MRLYIRDTYPHSCICQIVGSEDVWQLVRFTRKRRSLKKMVQRILVVLCCLAVTISIQGQRYVHNCLIYIYC